jgi:hypothetical protein
VQRAASISTRQRLIHDLARVAVKGAELDPRRASTVGDVAMHEHRPPCAQILAT